MQSNYTTGTLHGAPAREREHEKRPQNIHRPVQDYPVFDCRQLCEDQSYAHHVFSELLQKLKKKKQTDGTP